MGKRGKGHVSIKFPFQMCWYFEQPCTQIKSFQHRKEPYGFQHEFIVLNLDDGSICRIERMGDPDARSDALSPQGSVAQDIAQCFRKEDIADAHLDTSEIVAEIVLPQHYRYLDILDVLKTCRAIHEDERIHNYTLRGFNCHFFSLAIQCCLTRLVAGWEGISLNPTWTAALHTAVDSLPNSYSALSDARDQIPLLLRACFAADPSKAPSFEAFMQEVRSKLKSSLEMTLAPKHLDSTSFRELWCDGLDSVPLYLVQQGIKYALMEILKGHRSRTPPNFANEGALECARGKCVIALLRLLSSTNVGDESKCHLIRPPILSRFDRLYQLAYNQLADEPAQGSGAQFPAEMGYRGKATARTVTLTSAQWMSICWRYFKVLLWWTLNTFICMWGITLLTLDADPHPYVIIDDELELERMVDKLEQSDPTSTIDLNKFCQDVDALRKSPRASWLRRPWNDIQQVIERQLPPTRFLEQEAVTLEVRLHSLQGPLERMSVSEFQNYIRARIEYQAQQVEQVRLGSAVDAQAEIYSKLAQIWSLVYDEVDIAGIVTDLAGHDCPDLTQELDLTRISSFLVVGSGKNNIWRGALLDGSHVALKVLRQYRFDEKQLEYGRFEPRAVRELYAWTKARHENVLELRGIAVFNRSIAAVSPWMESGTIREYLGNHPSVDRMPLCIQVARGLAYLHGIPLIHGNLHGLNVFVTDDGIVKIGYIEGARLYGERDTRSPHRDDIPDIEPLRWAAPELASVEGGNPTRRTDVYALGRTIIEIITGRVPFDGMPLHEVYRMVAYKNQKPSPPQEITSMGERGNQLWGLLNQCWDHDPRMRPKAREVLQRLEEISNLPA